MTASDIQPNYVSWLNNPEVVRYSNQRFRTHTLETGRAYLDSFTDTGNLFLALLERKTGHLIGTLTVYRQIHHRTADIGIMLGEPSAWGQGLGLEAFELAMAWLFRATDVRKVTAGTMARNVGMVRIMEKSGMHLEATRHEQELLEGEPVDIVYFSRFKDA